MIVFSCIVTVLIAVFLPIMVRNSVPDPVIERKVKAESAALSWHLIFLS